MKATKTSVNIVLMGQFKPESFLPNALVEGNVITEKAAKSASILALMPSQTLQFRLDWAELMVLPERFQITSLEAPYIRICDFALKALLDLAPNSTVSQFGINVIGHYDLGSTDARNNLGRRVAPPEAWGTWGQTLLESMNGEHRGTILQGGMLNVQMKQPFSKDGVNGWRTVGLSSSLEIPNNTGVLLQTNHHHQVASLDPEDKGPFAGNATTVLLAALSSSFEKSIEDAFSIFDGVLSE